MVERAAAARGEQPARPVVDRLRSAGMSAADCCPNLTRTSGPVSSAYLSIRHAWFWRSLAVPARATDRWAQRPCEVGIFDTSPRYSGREHT